MPEEYHKVDKMTNGVVVSDAVKYVKAEKLDRQVKAEKDSAFDYESESEEVPQQVPTTPLFGQNIPQDYRH
jgi:hypothetical protein